ncbi:MAG: hypothetical protein M0R22_00185 [Dehalococcoidia bacterium]|jgi:hypothetical protein|nr:hypothetical protein [Dehalococcoidia bacterium]
MSLNRSDNDGGTWGIAMTSHGPLDMTQSKSDGTPAIFSKHQGLKPLGDVSRIRAFINECIENAKRAQGGVLPQVIEMEVSDGHGGVVSEHLLVPVALGSTTILTLQQAAATGIGAFTGVVSRLEDVSYLRQASVYEGMFRAEHPDADEAAVRTALAKFRQDSGTTEPNPAGMEEELRGMLVADGATPDAARATVAQATSALRGNSDDVSALTTTQNYAALATVLSSVASVSLTAAMEEPDYLQANDKLDTAVRVLNTITTVFDAVSAISSLVSATGAGAIVAVVFEILALVCRFITWLLDVIRDYTISPLEGWDKEWDGTDCTLILKERLRILVQIDETIIDSSATGWQKHWADAMERLGHNADAQFNLLTNMIYDTAWARGEERIAAAKAIAQTLGGRAATKSFNECDDIANWLGYIGVPADDVYTIRTWLYEARKVTVVQARRNRLRSMVGDAPHGGVSGYGVEYTGNMVNYLHSEGKDCPNDRESRCHVLGGDGYYCQTNFRAGADPWYRDCRNIDISSSSQFVPFSIQQLDALWDELRNKLRVSRSWPAPVSPPLTFKDFILSAPRQLSLFKMLAPGASSAQIDQFAILDVGTPQYRRAAVVLRGVPDSVLAPEVISASRRITAGGETMRLWWADTWFISNGTVFLYVHYLPVDAGRRGYVAEGIPASDSFLRSASDADLQRKLYDQLGIGTMSGLSGTSGSGGGGGTALVVGGAVVAGIAAALLLKK